MLQPYASICGGGGVGLGVGFRVGVGVGVGGGGLPRRSSHLHCSLLCFVVTTASCRRSMAANRAEYRSSSDMVGGRCARTQPGAAWRTLTRGICTVPKEVEEEEEEEEKEERGLAFEHQKRLRAEDSY